MSIQSGIDTAAVTSINGDPVVTLAHHRLLGSSYQYGEIYADEIAAPLVLTFDDFKELIDDAQKFIEQVNTTNHFRVKGQPGSPFTLTTIDVGDDKEYTLILDTITQIITWDSSENEITLPARAAFTMSLTCYAYFIQTVVDFIVEIDSI